MEAEPLREEAVKAFAKEKMLTDVTLKTDQQFQSIAGGLDFDGSFRLFHMWTYHDHFAVLKPGFLDELVKDNPQSYKGARIEVECRNLSDDPRDWTFFTVVILEVKSRQGGEARTILGLLGGPPKKAVPCDDRTHDESNDEESVPRKRKRIA